MYRHALPPGFVLKAQKKAMDEAERANQISIEEFLEVEVRLRRPFRLRLCLWLMLIREVDVRDPSDR